MAAIAAARSAFSAGRVKLTGWAPIVIFVTLGLGVYLETRLWLIAKFPYFLDEGILAYYAELGRDPDQRLISLQEGFRPGLVWLTLGGMRLHFDPFVSIRLAAVLFGAIAVICGTVLAWRYVGQVAALAFAVLSILTPFLVLYDSLGLRDPVIGGLMVAGLLLEIELARRPRFGIAVLLGLSFGLDVLVKDSGKAALYLIPVSLAYFPFRSPQRARLAAAWVLNIAVALILAYVATLPMQLSSAYRDLGATQQIADDTRSFSSVAAHPLRYFDQSWPGVRGELTSYVTYPILALVLIGLVLGLRRRPRFTAVVAVWAVAQLSSVIWLAGNLNARYLVPTIPFLLLLAAVGVEELVGLARRVLDSERRLVTVSVAAGVLVLVPAVVFDAQMSYATASAPYPANDKLGFITGFASGYGVEPAIGELKVLAGGQQLNLLSNPANATETFEVMGMMRGVNLNWIWTNDPAASTAALLTNGNPVPPGVGRFREIWSYQRPDGGTPIKIYVHEAPAG